MKDKKYIIYLAVLFGAYVAIQLIGPRTFDWTITYAHDDKDPYGTYVLHELFPSLLPDVPVRHSYQTLYELKDSLDENENVFIISNYFDASNEDAEALLDHVGRGATAFISAQYWYGHFADTLKLKTDAGEFPNDAFSRDSAALYIINAGSSTTHGFWFRRQDVHAHFTSFDSTRTMIVAEKAGGEPVTIRLKWGKGNLLLNTTPLAFTNIYVLSADNNQFVSQNLSYLQPEPVRRTEFYHLGRMESKTPLRFILTTEPLKWAYYLTIGGVLIYMIFQARRKQRVIPVIEPLPNTTLQFVSTIGNLYFQNGDHKNIADKKISFFLEHVRTKYFLPTNKLDDGFIRTLAAKSGKPELQVMELLNTINYIMKTSSINVIILQDLNEKIERFYNEDEL